LSANTETTKQPTLGGQTDKQMVRQRARGRITEAHGLCESKRFLLCCPSDADIDELPELWEAYQDAMRGEQ